MTNKQGNTEQSTNHKAMIQQGFDTVATGLNYYI
jgi:hypothetical protein